MQIHEITKKSLREGILGNIGRGFASGVTGADIPQSQASIERDAAAAAEKLRAQGYGQPAKIPSVQDAVAAVQKNAQQQQFIKGLVAQWQQQAPKPEPVAPAPGTPTAPFAGRAAPLPTVSIGSVGQLTKGPDGQWRNEKGQPVTDPAQAAKIDKAYRDQEIRKAQTKMTAMVKERVSNPQRTAALRAQRAAGRKPAGAAITPTSAPTNAYQAEFEKWAAQQLKTSIPRVGTVTLDDIKTTDIRDELDRALAQVVATAGDAQKNAVAVNNYLTIAVAGVARRSQQLRNEMGGGGGAVPGSSQASGAIVTQQGIKDQLIKDVELNTNQIEKLKKLAQDPAARQALFKSWGLV